MERSIILVDGVPGGGKSTLSKNIVKQLQPDYLVEHISIGNTIRAIGKGAIASVYAQRVALHLNSINATQLIDDDVMFGITHEALERSDAAELVLLDGYPRRISQVDDMFTLAEAVDRTVAGRLVVDTPDHIAVSRMLKRKPRDFSLPLTTDDARERLRAYHQAHAEMLHGLHSKRMPPFEMIDTTGSNESATRNALLAVKYFLSPSDTQVEDAS